MLTQITVSNRVFELIELNKIIKHDLERKKTTVLNPIAIFVVKVNLIKKTH